MRRYQKTFLSVLVFLLFIFCSYGLAQDTEILTDENYRQEIQKYMVNPCIEGVFTYMVKKDMLKGYVTIDEFIQIYDKDLPTNLLEKFTKTFEHVKDKPERDRMIWYKLATGVCTEAAKEKFLVKDEDKKSSPQQADRFGNKEQPTHHQGIPAQAKRDAIRTCKERLKLINSMGSWSMLNACVEDELENYREFHQNYGDMTDSP